METERSTRAYVLDGVLVALRGPCIYMSLTFLGIGGLAQQADVSLLFAMTATILIWAGPAQVIFFAALINGLALPAIALAVSLSSVRMVPMCVSVLPLLRGAKRRWVVLYATHHIAVTIWVECIRRLPKMPEHGRIPFFMGVAHTLMVFAVGATIIGYVLVESLPTALAAGLLFVTPVYFLLALVRNASDRQDWLALILGAGILPLAGAFVGSGIDLLVAGIGGGSVAYAIQRIMKARARKHSADAKTTSAGDQP